jgi:hypothetical protein
MKKKPVRKRSRAKKAPARQIVRPQNRPSAANDAAENRRRAQYGDLHKTPGVMLFDFLTQIVTSKPDPRLCQLFTQELVELHKAKNGKPLRELAQLIERPIAHPAQEIAYTIEAYYQTAIASAADAKTPKGRRKVPCVPPQVKRAEIIESIREQTNCSERTATSAIDNTSLAQLLGWKAGRPRD